jgi:hypothetical protein
VGGSEDEVVLEVLGGSAEDEGGGFEEAVVVLDEDVSDLERSSFMPTALQRLLAKASASEGDRCQLVGSWDGMG